MIVDRRRILGGFAVFALVLLRLVVGWHFFGEGTKKLQYDASERQFHLAFTADKELLDKAKGPLTEWYLDFVPSGHDSRHLLATPRENVRPTDQELDAENKWQHEYNSRRAAAAKKNEPAPVEFPPSAPYHDWAEKIAVDWRAAADRVKSIAGFAEDQKKKIDAALESHLETLADYLAGEAESITAYRHDLFRLDNWRKSPEAANVPFFQQRIATKTTETSAQLKPWLAQIDALDASFDDDLAATLTPEQEKQPSTTSAFRAAIVDNHQSRLDTLNIVVTIVTIGVGACLLLGFFTRLASLVGALFLIGVIASQPFWIADSVPTINQCIECAALLALAGTRAGRWLGIDALIYTLFHRNRTVETF